jgi:hypothetical protein
LKHVFSHFLFFCVCKVCPDSLLPFVLYCCVSFSGDYQISFLLSVCEIFPFFKSANTPPR